MPYEFKPDIDPAVHAVVRETLERPDPNASASSALDEALRRASEARDNANAAGVWVCKATEMLEGLLALQAWCLEESDRQLADDHTDETALEMRRLSTP